MDLILLVNFMYLYNLSKIINFDSLLNLFYYIVISCNKNKQ